MLVACNFLSGNTNILFTSSSVLLETLSAQVDEGSTIPNVTTRFPVTEFSIIEKILYSSCKNNNKKGT